jgi:hypothetical protein
MQLALSLAANAAPSHRTHSALEFANAVRVCALPGGHARQLPVSSDR